MSGHKFSALFISTVFLATTFLAQNAAALELIGFDAGAIGIKAVVRGGAMTDPAPDGTDLGPMGFDVDMARFAVNLRIHQAIRSMVQLEAHTGDVKLLDARLDWQMARGARLRMGRFKTPVNAEFNQYGLPDVMLRNRPGPFALVPRRSDGAMLTVGREGGRIRPEFNMGVFWGDILEETRATPNLAVSSMRVRVNQSWLVHAGVSSPMLSGAEARPLLDLALIYDDEVDLQAGIEGAFKMAAIQAEQENALGAWIAYAFYSPGQTWTIVPALGLDVAGPALVEGWSSKARAEVRVGREELASWLRFGTLLGPNETGVDVDTYLLLQVGLD